MNKILLLKAIKFIVAVPGEYCLLKAAEWDEAAAYWNDLGCYDRMECALSLANLCYSMAAALPGQEAAA